MRLFSFLVISVLALYPHWTFAKELNGNLDYIVRTDNGTVKLTLTNKTPDTPVRLTGVAIFVLPSKKQLPISISPGQLIAQSVTVELGSVSALAKQIAPTKNVAAFKSVAGSDSNSCQNCNVIGFGLQINVEYGGDIKQNILTEAYLHYFVH